MSGPLEIIGDDSGAVCKDGVCEVPPTHDADFDGTGRDESGPNVPAGETKAVTASPDGVVTVGTAQTSPGNGRRKN